MKMQDKGWTAELARALLWLLMPAVVAALQLPPDIQADRYLVRAQRQIEEQDFAGAKQSMEQILELRSRSMAWRFPRSFSTGMRRSWTGWISMTKRSRPRRSI